MNDEYEWIRTIARENERIDQARRIRPGRGHRVQLPHHDWWILAIVIGALIAGVVL